MKFGVLDFLPADQHPKLLAPPTRVAIKDLELEGVLISGVDEALSDTTAFCDHYGIGLDTAANCVIIEAKRADKVWYAACMILATTRADVNGTIRRHLNARKISFAPMDTATTLTGMMYGGITPIGLPTDWPILVDTRVAQTERAIVGSGLRKSKLLVPGKLLAQLPNAAVLNIVKE